MTTYEELRDLVTENVGSYPYKSDQETKKEIEELTKKDNDDPTIIVFDNEGELVDFVVVDSDSIRCPDCNKDYETLILSYPEESLIQMERKEDFSLIEWDSENGTLKFEFSCLCNKREHGHSAELDIENSLYTVTPFRGTITTEERVRIHNMFTAETNKYMKIMIELPRSEPLCVGDLDIGDFFSPDYSPDTVYVLGEPDEDTGEESTKCYHANIKFGITPFNKTDKVRKILADKIPYDTNDYIARGFEEQYDRMKMWWEIAGRIPRED